MPIQITILSAMPMAMYIALRSPPAIATSDQRSSLSDESCDTVQVDPERRRLSHRRIVNLACGFIVVSLNLVVSSGQLPYAPIYCSYAGVTFLDIVIGLPGFTLPVPASDRPEKGADTLATK